MHGSKFPLSYVTENLKKNNKKLFNNEVVQIEQASIDSMLLSTVETKQGL